MSKHKKLPLISLIVMTTATTPFVSMTLAQAAVLSKMKASTNAAAVGAQTFGQNLAQSATITTAVTGVPDSEFAGYEQSYQAPLTGTSGWTGFCRQGGRDITITLPQASNIQSISIDLEQDSSQGVRYPSDVDFEVNRNGTWYSLGQVYSSIPLTDVRRTVQTFSVHLNQVSGQMFRIHIPVGVWVFARNLQVIGTPGGSTSVPQASSPVPTQTSYQAPMSPNDNRDHGIHNMLLVYTGGYGQQGTWSVNDFLPMVAYTPLGGTAATGRMFDSMLFLPYGTVADTEAGWSAYLQDLFTPNQQLSALDQAVATQNQALGTTNFKENVVLTLPYSPYGTNDWGLLNGRDINFAGTPTDPNAVSARESAMQWYMQTVMADWTQANFQHLNLTGIYWEHEQCEYSMPGEVALIKDASSLAHSQNLPLYWIPFYGASHTADWQSLGFDAAWLQPNYVEQGNAADISRLTNAEEQATQIGAGVELELNGMDPLNESLYEQTLSQFEQDHFTQSVSHAFYAESKDLVTAANSSDPNTRALYDNTYAFITSP